MRHVLQLALSFTAIAVAGPPSLTIVLEFQGPHSERSIGEMKREFETIMQDTGMHFDWRTRDELQQKSVDNLVVVRFKGKCVFQPVAYLYDERGPLAFTYSTSGFVQPFSEVACDQVTASVRSAIFGGDYSRADLLLGRALGRVVAHEVVHMLTQSAEHQKKGVQKAALSGALLISPELKLTDEDIDQLKTLP